MKKFLKDASKFAKSWSDQKKMNVLGLGIVCVSVFAIGTVLL